MQTLKNAFRELVKVLGVTEIVVRTRRGCFVVAVDDPKDKTSCAFCDSCGWEWRQFGKKIRVYPCRKCFGQR